MAFETNIPFKGEHSELSESSLSKFYNALGNHGVLIKSNYACKFEFFSPDTNYNEQLTFYCQSIDIPGLKTSNTELFYKGRTI
jgi:hypothetical protein